MMGCCASKGLPIAPAEDRAMAIMTVRNDIGDFVRQ